MRWQKIYETLLKYEDENKKGWYSYTWCNGGVTIARKSDPETQYCLNLRNEIVFIEKLVSVNTEGKYRWDYTEKIERNDLPEADDYSVAYSVSHPFIAMIVIKEDVSEDPKSLVLKDSEYKTAQEIREKERNQKALNNIKTIIYRCGEITYQKRHGWSTKYSLPEWMQNCGFAGMGENEYTGAEFYLNDREFFICTNGNIARENKHRRHFGEPEWLFPWQSNNLERDNVLYVRTSSLSIFRDNALKEEKEAAIRDLKCLLKDAGITDYDIIEIRKPYKYQNRIGG